MWKSTFGSYGEWIAVELYRSEGYEIIARNLQNQYGEIDFLCKKDGCLHVVEVKSLGKSNFNSLSNLISPLKQAKIKRCLDMYINDNYLIIGNSSYDFDEISFDVATIRLGIFKGCY